MDYNNYITFETKRKRWEHLKTEDRGAIEILHKLGYSNRSIARLLNCSPTTISNELNRGTPLRKSNKGRHPIYIAKRGDIVYKLNRTRCRKAHRIYECKDFVFWVCDQLKMQKWTFDACVGYAKRHNLFKAEDMVCTKTLYNELKNRNLPITLFDVPLVLKRRKMREKREKNTRIRGKSIEERPKIEPGEFGHWEGDTIIGKKKGKESVILCLNEKATNMYIAIKIASKTARAVNNAITELRKEYGNKFSQVFKTITVDNGKEFNSFYETEKFGIKVYYAHPYSSWERGQNERNNGLYRAYVAKGESIDNYTAEEIQMYADELNARPRRKLNYATSEELFENYLDMIYAVN